MKYLEEFRNPESVKSLAEQIGHLASRPWKIMEVCGGQTRSILRHGLAQMLPEGIELLHGPGCPVCVTPGSTIEHARLIARQPRVTFCSFGDMLRVPGPEGNDLLSAKAAGADVRIVYSPLDALIIAQKNPDREVIFFAVGFETTAPATALAVVKAEAAGVKNFSLLVSHMLVPPVLEAILSSAVNQVDGFLAAGHVCAVTGQKDYQEISERFRIPIVISGFEPVDLMLAIATCIRHLEEHRFGVVNQYQRVVRNAGNSFAQDLVHEVFSRKSQKWRGIGVLPESGLMLRPRFASFDAWRRYRPLRLFEPSPGVCKAGPVLMGALKPTDCPGFGRECTPQRPLGAPMVSAEGVCAAYFDYRSSENGESSCS